MTEYSVKLSDFEGPLDLLIELLRKKQKDIFDIDIAEITTQYLDFINLHADSLDISSEYLVMASYLIEIKSKSLLPKSVIEIDSDYEEDERENLIKRLVEYKRYKDAVIDLKDKQDERGNYFIKPALLDLSIYKSDVEEEEVVLPKNLDVFNLMSAFKKMQERTYHNRPRVATIVTPSIDIKELSDEIEKIIFEKKECLFTELFEDPERQNMDYFVTSFMVVLTLTRHQKIYLDQVSEMDLKLTWKGGRMETKELIAVLEGLLYISGEDGITLKEIGKILELTRPKAKQLVSLYEEYLEDEVARGVMLVKFDDYYKLATKPKYANYFAKLMDTSSRQVRLSQAAMETLAIYAYKGPITRIEVEAIRGVSADAMTKKLLALDMIEEKGRSDDPGRPIIYAVTPTFYDSFGISSKSELPELKEIKVDDGDQDLFQTNRPQEVR